VHRLQSGKDEECSLFQTVAEQGHYGGRTQPTNTRQGTYAAAPSGVLLASVNSNDPRRMEQMLREALEKWEKMPREERLLKNVPDDFRVEAERDSPHYPADGLVLRVNSRDLPRPNQVSGWRATAFNQDFAWFRKDEARSFVPQDPAVGQATEVPDRLVRRIATAHLVDNVRGQTTPFDNQHVQKARLTSTVVERNGDSVFLELDGETKTEATGKWSVSGFQDMHQPSEQKRGVATKLLGRARYDLKAERFTSFEVVAVGDRWGATQYNGRSDDRGPAPIGYAFTLAGDTPAERVEPAYFWRYGWR
jgi:hypothetical protein